MRLLCVTATLLLASPIWAQGPNERKDPYSVTLAQNIKRAASHAPPVLEGPKSATPTAMPAPKINVPLAERFMTKTRYRNMMAAQVATRTQAAPPKLKPLATPTKPAFARPPPAQMAPPSARPPVQPGQVASASQSEKDAKVKKWMQSKRQANREKVKA